MIGCTKNNKTVKTDKQERYNIKKNNKTKTTERGETDHVQIKFSEEWLMTVLNILFENLWPN